MTIALLFACHGAASIVETDPAGHDSPTGDTEAGADTEVPADTEVTGSPVDECEFPSLIDLLPGAFPPNPTTDFGPAPECAQQRHDAIVILGCPNKDDGTFSDCQRGRVEKALRFAAAGYGDRYIVTGGAVANEYVEAESLRALLVEGGVATGAIFLEPQAQHTDENLYYSSLIMAEHGWTSAMVISEPEHLMYAAICDANCCVKLGRLETFAYPVGDATESAATYVLTGPVTDAECAHIEQPLKFLCINLASRLACADDFQL